MPSSPSDPPAAQRLKKLKTLRLNKKSEDFSESTLMHGLAPETDLFYNQWQFIHAMKNLKTFGFTNRTDRAHSTDGWYLDDLEPVHTLEGNDVISTSGSIA